MNVKSYGVGVFSIDSFLSKDECRKLIDDSECLNYEKATIQAINGPKLDEEIRYNDRIIFDDTALATRLYEKAKHLLPEVVDGW